MINNCVVVYHELETLEKELGINAKTLYSVSYNLKSHYRTEKLPKNDGTYRHLSIPDYTLKRIQRVINEKILNYMPVSEYATAYEFGRSIKSNAIPHCNKRYVLKLDISSYFDSITYAKVKKKVFCEKYFSEQIRILLTMLCYYKDALPQGAPTSPKIANIILYDFDMRVGEWCKERGITYTRYCDDMTFSSDNDLTDVYDYIKTELRKEGFFLKTKKTKLVNSNYRQTVTGIVVNEKLSVPKEYIRKVEQELYYCKKFGAKNHLERLKKDIDSVKYLNSLSGKVNYILSISPHNSKMKQWREWLKCEIKYNKKEIENHYKER